MLGMVIGLAIGLMFPAVSGTLNIITTIFLNAIKLIVAPLIFVMMVLGIARLEDLRKVGKLALVSIIYFELVTTIALFWGLLLGNLVAPGKGMHIDPSSVDRSAINPLVDKVQEHHTFLDFLLSLVPSNVVGPFLDNNIIQVLVVAVIVGCSITCLDGRKKGVIDALELAERIIFIIIGFVMRLAPIAVAASTAFVVGRYGSATILSLAKLVGTIYFGCILLIAVLFTAIAWMSGFSILKLVRYIREEIILTFATASSEAALPKLLIKVTKAGVPEAVSGFVLPTGYSFNLDGGSINLVVCALFVAQAFDVSLSLIDQLSIVAIFALTSKGTAGVPGGGLVVFASSMLMMPQLPLAGLAFIIAVDRFNDPIRSATNMLGNALATFFISWWVGARDDRRMIEAFEGSRLQSDV
jgi:aerobic C4-dicarboxylate transport protein